MNIYWAPASKSVNNNWNILYESLESLYVDLSKMNAVKCPPKNNFFKCPAFKNTSLSTFVIKNPIETEFVIHDPNNVQILSKNSISVNVRQEPSPLGNYLISYEIPYIFYSDEPVEMSISSPFFHKNSHTQYGNIIPGAFDISKWFRQTNIEFHMYDNYMKIEEDEPIMYVHFNTNKTINLQRFSMSDKLYDISNTISNSSSWESGVPLLKRYKRFTSSKTDKIVMKEIKKNLVA